MREVYSTEEIKDITEQFKLMEDFINQLETNINEHTDGEDIHKISLVAGKLSGQYRMIADKLGIFKREE